MKLPKGFVRIYMAGRLHDFNCMCSERELEPIAKVLYKQYPGEEGRINFSSKLMVQFSDKRKDKKLDEIIPYN